MKKFWEDFTWLFKFNQCFWELTSLVTLITYPKGRVSKSTILDIIINLKRGSIWVDTIIILIFLAKKFKVLWFLNLITLKYIFLTPLRWDLFGGLAFKLRAVSGEFVLIIKRKVLFKLYRLLRRFYLLFRLFFGLVFIYYYLRTSILNIVRFSTFISSNYFRFVSTLGPDILLLGLCLLGLVRIVILGCESSTSFNSVDIHLLSISLVIN